MSTNPYRGMTVNEALACAGLIEAWDAAVMARDRRAMISILESVRLGSEAASIADQVLKDPSRYGY